MFKVVIGDGMYVTTGLALGPSLSWRGLRVCYSSIEVEGISRVGGQVVCVTVSVLVALVALPPLVWCPPEPRSISVVYK
jgi:hypothetical protein